MPQHDAEDVDDSQPVVGWDERRVAEVHLDDTGQVTYLALDSSWPEIVSADELGAGIIEAYGAALTVLNEQAVAALENEQREPLPPVVPKVQALRERAERRRAEAGSGPDGHAKTASPADGGPDGHADAEERLEAARQLVDVSRAARQQSEAFGQRMISVRQEKHVHESPDRSVTLTSTYGVPVEFTIDEKWANRRTEDLVSVLIALIDEATDSRRRTDEAIASDFPEIVALVSAGGRS
ncbi:hypothetical protein CZ771_09185 [Actinomycetales bacterium JB111]|nr:hypothetical protein CZ771_09185 [Actinomycetales bacterium JB111]